ncbi:hypothetical protein SCHIN_v1c10350 [Spiroplasma chinense]|uniref:Uncharacterized protein n=1 Tax=Spiroplasma chinense TaxID=216932 RepID=A0A5B9Y4Y2_9MOLU|nr:hypothetical protein [Spiroplasma chinense]QEH62228.1 hypothetical protein SCHIN_v1c10350 [Spiroplasma chinense]
MVLEIFKRTFEDITNYYNNDWFKRIKIEGQEAEVIYDEKHFWQINDVEHLREFFEAVVKKVHVLRQANQSQLSTEGEQVRDFARNEVILASANVAYESLLDCLNDINYLISKNGDRPGFEINQKFAVRKVLTIGLNVQAKYEQLPNRLKKSKDLENIIEDINKMSTMENIDDIVEVSKGILDKYNDILNLDKLINYEDCVEEYGWIHDVVRISKINAGVVGFLVNLDLYDNILNENVYKNSKVKAI